ncbi:MFS transporter [Ornithinibacillus xuwenensis]|uniref:MFS transporter n=1 Tax=Ornithinibacillus xuwenensis TaxID=3144668 RepID=A0ABU9XLB0_9BACI
MMETVAVPNATKRFRYGVITFMLFWCALIVVSGAYVTTPLFGVFEDTFQVSKTMSAWTSSSFSFFYAVGFLLFGPLADRIGRKQIILLGLFSLTLVTIWIGMVSSFGSLIALRGLQGFVAATFAPSALAYAFEIFPKQKLVTTIGFISFGYVTSGIFGQVIADLIYQWANWEMVFLFLGGMYCITFVAVIFLLPNTAREQGKKGVRFYLYHSKLILKQRNFLLTYSITIMLLLTFMGMYTLLGSYLSGEPYNLSGEAILGIRALGIIGMVISPLTGRIVQRIGLLLTLRIGLGMAVLGLFLLGIGSHIVFLVLMSIIYVMGISMIFPAIMMVIGELGGERRALANAFYAFILFIGAMLGPIIAIWLLSIGSYRSTFFILSLLLVIGFVLSMFIQVKSQVQGT